MANRYWIGQSGENRAFNNSSYWSTTSGGSGGASIPTSSDDIIFDENSAGDCYFDKRSDFNSITTTSGFQHNINLGNYKSYCSGDIRLEGGRVYSGQSTSAFYGLSVSTVEIYSTIDIEFSIEIRGTLTLMSDITACIYSRRLIGSSANNTLNANGFNLTLKPTSNFSCFYGLDTINGGTLTFDGVDITRINESVLGFNNIVVVSKSSSFKEIDFQNKSLSLPPLEIKHSQATPINTQLSRLGSGSFFKKIKINLEGGSMFKANTSFDVEEFEVVQTPDEPIKIEPSSSDSGARLDIHKTTAGIISLDYISPERTNVTPADTWYAGNNSVDRGNNTGWIFSAPPQPPVTETHEATNIANILATLNGEITSLGDNTPTKRGFAFGETSQNPTGDPDSSGYDNYWEESGSFSIGAFSHIAQGLKENTNYYFRAFAYSSDGYGWGEEMSFKTLLIPAPTIEYIDPNVIKTETQETITIKGQNFLDGLEVEIDNEPCSEIVVVDSETITCKAPESETQKTTTLKVTNPDGKSGTFPFYYMKEIPNPEPKPKIEAKLEVGIIETI